MTDWCWAGGGAWRLAGHADGGRSGGGDRPPRYLLSIVADVVGRAPGRPLALVMAAFSVAQIRSVPSRWCCRQHLGWRSPFFITAGGLLVVGRRSAPCLRCAGTSSQGRSPFKQALRETPEIIRTPMVQLSYPPRRW
jgi:predicted MFS family arabinose efflux permease